jgi:hypothetical protein
LGLQSTSRARRLAHGSQEELELSDVSQEQLGLAGDADSKKKVGWMKNAPFYKYKLHNWPATTYLACCHNRCARCGWGAAGFKLQRQGSICRSKREHDHAKVVLHDRCADTILLLLRVMIQQGLCGCIA